MALSSAAEINPLFAPDVGTSIRPPLAPIRILSSLVQLRPHTPASSGSSKTASGTPPRIEMV